MCSFRCHQGRRRLCASHAAAQVLA
uniref:Uncharacterized protein n=1 Tax=Arundo donax TaxID=35708 RepID=A0A0A9HFL2_ARUDO